jgi:tol-pal system protein YbgF
MKQDVLRVEEQVKQVRNDQKLLNARIARLDSLISGGTSDDDRLRAEIRTSTDDLNDQLNKLQNQINDLQQLVYVLTQRVPEGTTMPAQPPVQPVDTTAADTAQAADTAATSSVDCRQVWDTAFKDMYRGQYDLAITGFSDYLKYCPNTDMADNSQYWIAEAYYEMDQHEQAIAEYTKLLEVYPDSEKKATAYFKLGRTYEKLGDTTKAIEYFTILQNEFPGSVEFEQVRDKLNQWQEGNDQ